MTADNTHFRSLLSLGLISGSVIGFQLALMGYFSNTQWSHFAFMVISVALLGFGASGTLITLCRSWFRQHGRILIACAMLLCAVFMIMCIPFCQLERFRFDSLLLFSESGQVFRLAATYLILFLPFFFSGLAIGLILIQNIDNIGRFYFVNLLGSGMGGLGSLVLFHFFSPVLLPAVMAILPLLSAGIFYWKNSVFRFFILLVSGGMIFILIMPPVLERSEFKHINNITQLPKTRMIHEQPTPFGLIQVVSSPVLRYAPGVSLQYRKKIPAVDAVFVNGDWLGAVLDTKPDGQPHIFDYAPFALPFCIQYSKNILSLSSGTGSLISQALAHHPEHITALEKNPVIPELLNSLYKTRSVYTHARVDTRQVHDYTFLFSTRRQYDLVLLPVLDAFGGSSGLYALNEQYHLTREAFLMMWERLTDNGMITVSTWLDYPVRNPLRILSTLVSVLESNGLDHFKEYIVSVRSWNMITFVLKKSAFSAEEISRIRDFAMEMNFDPVLLPDIIEDERSRFNRLPDQDFFALIDALMDNGREDFIRNYEFNIAPATENRPYFFQNLKPGHFFHLKTFYTTTSIPFLELGYLLLLFTLVQVFVFAVVLILLPLVFRKWSGSHKRWTVIYFAALGLGFMCIEIVLIQQFILYFGNPLYAAAAVISAVLVFSGLGSLLTSKLEPSCWTIMVCLLLIVLAGLLYIFLLTPLLKQTMDMGFLWKIFFSLVLIAPLSFLMGMPFPLGLRLAEKTNPLNVSWAWSVNGCSSVISAVMAAVIAIEYGFVCVMMTAVCLYGTACAATFLISKKQSA